MDRRFFCLCKPFSCKACPGKPGHTTSGSGRGAWRGGGAGSGRTGCQQNCSPRRQGSLVLSKASKNRHLTVSLKERTIKICLNRMREQNQRLTRDLCALYQRDRERSSFLAADQWTDDFLSLNLFHARHVWEIGVRRRYKFVESKTRTYHKRVGSGRTAGWPGGVGQDWVPTELLAQETSFPCTFPSIANTSPERLSRSTNKRIPM